MEVLSSFVKRIKSQLLNNSQQRVQLLNIANQYIGLLPSLASEPDFSRSSSLKQLMVLVVVEFQHQANTENSHIKQLLQKCSQLLCLSKFEVTPDAIYFYNYMAMSMQNPTTYLESLLDYIFQNLKTILPSTLGIDLASADFSSLQNFHDLLK